VKVPLPQIHATIHEEGDVSIVLFSAVCLMAKLGTPDAGKSLARRAADQYVHLSIDRTANPEVSEDRGRVFLCNVPSFEMRLFVLAVAYSGEVGSMGFRGTWV
jgi:hypothetical protein